MPLIDPNHLSPTGQRIVPPVNDVTPDPMSRPVPVSASQLNADIAAYLRELEQLRRMVMIKIIGETNG